MFFEADALMGPLEKRAAGLRKLQLWLVSQGSSDPLLVFLFSRALDECRVKKPYASYVQ
jgi:hypothetical protein